MVKTSSSGNLSDSAELPLTRTLIKAIILAIPSHTKLGCGRIQPRGDEPTLGTIRSGVTATEAVVKST